MSRNPVIFETRHRARFREIDAYGHMNMTHYVTYISDHRFQGMREVLGLGFKELDELPIAFFIRHFEIEYLRPLMADQEFVIRSHVTEVLRSQCYVEFQLSAADDTPVATAKMRIGCIVKATQRPGAWPEGLMERFFT
jgi:YbgC/YbaW family acyl-CoA thioester hydrolase